EAHHFLKPGKQSRSSERRSFLTLLNAAHPPRERLRSRRQTVRDSLRTPLRARFRTTRTWTGRGYRSPQVPALMPKRSGVGSQAAAASAPTGLQAVLECGGCVRYGVSRRIGGCGSGCAPSGTTDNPLFDPADVTTWAVPAAG